MKVIDVSIAGVCGGFTETFPIGAVVSRAPTIKNGQTHVHRCLRPLRGRIREGDIDPSFINTHRMKLSDARREARCSRTSRTIA